MTYGWALLVVLIAISALAFFGVLNPKNFLPDQCFLFSGASCLEPYAGIKNIFGFDVVVFRFIFVNGFSYTMKGILIDLKVNDVSIPSIISDDYLGQFPPGYTVTCMAPNKDLGSGQSVPCGYSNFASVMGVKVGDKIKGEIVLRWTDPSGNQRKRTGAFVSTVSQI